MTQTTLTFEEIDALLKFIEFHTECIVDEESAEELNELVGCDVDALYNKLSEMQDEVWWFPFLILPQWLITTLTFKI